MPPFLPNVPRCQHLKVNGTQCGSPALRRNLFCFFHKRFQEERIKLSGDRARHGRASFTLPVLEDANSIQVALMQIMRLLASGQIEPKTAGLLLFALQTASINLRRTNVEPAHVMDVVIDRNTIDQTCIGGDQWCEEDFEDDEEEKEDAEPGAIAAKAEAGKPVPRSSATQLPPAGKKQPAAAEIRQPRAAAKTIGAAPVKKVDMNQVRQKVRGMARDWIMKEAWKRGAKEAWKSGTSAPRQASRNSTSATVATRLPSAGTPPARGHQKLEAGS